jgi:hypothetical protein
MMSDSSDKDLVKYNPGITSASATSQRMHPCSLMITYIFLSNPLLLLLPGGGEQFGSDNNDRQIQAKKKKKNN